MSPNREFFQVAATAIPTSLIAIAIGARSADDYIHNHANTAKALERGIAVCTALMITAIAIAGELSALIALGTGRSTSFEADAVTLAIILLLFSISAVLINPIVSALKSRVTRLVSYLILFAGLATAIFVSFAALSL